MKRQLTFPPSQMQGIQWLKKFKTNCATKKLPMYQLAIELSESQLMIVPFKKYI